jgi:hypothetical protein
MLLNKHVFKAANREAADYRLMTSVIDEKQRVRLSVTVAIETGPQTGTWEYGGLPVFQLSQPFYTVQTLLSISTT